MHTARFLHLTSPVQVETQENLHQDVYFVIVLLALLDVCIQPLGSYLKLRYFTAIP